MLFIEKQGTNALKKQKDTDGLNDVYSILISELKKQQEVKYSTVCSKNYDLNKVRKIIVSKFFWC